jgi:hypothetical protein
MIQLAMEVTIKAKKSIGGKTYTTPPFKTTTSALAKPQDAELALLRFRNFAEGWFERVRLKLRKARA